MMIKVQRYHRTIIIHSEFHPVDLSSQDLMASFQFHVDRYGHMGSLMELEPLPPGVDLMLPNLALAFGIGIAANLLWSEPKTSALTLKFPGLDGSGW